MEHDRLITLAIHTYERALSVKALLEREGVGVELNNVNLADPQVSAGVRVRIKESDLPLALRIVENREMFEPTDTADGRAGKPGGKILVPTDFSDLSLQAAKTAMHLAARWGAEIEFLYAFIPPTDSDTIQLSDSYDYELADIAETQQMNKEGKLLMKRFADKVRAAVKSGEVPGVKFSTAVTEGIPENAILDYIHGNKPQMLVMGTRAADKKESELIGSVTAEVLDNCRVPAITIPEDMETPLLKRLRKVAFLCNLDQEDILALDALFRFFPDLRLNVTLLHVTPRRILRSAPEMTMKNLLQYCESHYPGYRFDTRIVDPKTLKSDLKELNGHLPYDMLSMPNRHKNAIARVFNPGLAHKILFSADVPMAVIPV